MSRLAFTSHLLESPLGPLRLVVDDDRVVRALEWTDHDDRLRALLKRQYAHSLTLSDGGPAPEDVTRLMAAYFDGRLDALTRIPIAHGGTPFQRKAWEALRAIPAGQTRTYGEQARAMGMERAVRAVGLANGANPIGIIVPCHRVIGARGALTGYGGGLARKHWLLAHEGARLPPMNPSLF